MRLPDVLSPADLPAAELAALRLDGALVAVGPSWCPVDLPDTLGLRAAAVAVVLPTPFVADRRTAAWVLGALPVAPSGLEAAVPVDERGPTPPPGVRLRELRFELGDLTRMGPLRLTTPLRTVLDLLREPRLDEADGHAVASLCAQVGVETIETALAEARFGVGRRLARRRLAAAQPAETR